jgi:hypothetical protein
MNICKRCAQTKPPDAFKRYASLAQSRIWTRNPHMKRPIEYESVVCNECARTKRTATLDLSPENARKRMVNEGENLFVIEETVKRIKENSLHRKRVTILKNRQALFADAYADMTKQLDREKKRAMRAPDGVRLSEILRANEIFKHLKHEGRKPPKSWVELLSNKFATWCSKTKD